MLPLLLLLQVRSSLSLHTFRVWQYLERLGNQTKLDAAVEAAAKATRDKRDDSWGAIRDEQAARSRSEEATCVCAAAACCGVLRRFFCGISASFQRRLASF